MPLPPAIGWRGIIKKGRKNSTCKSKEANEGILFFFIYLKYREIPRGNPFYDILGGLSEGGMHPYRMTSPLLVIAMEAMQFVVYDEYNIMQVKNNIIYYSLRNKWPLSILLTRAQRLAAARPDTVRASYRQSIRRPLEGGSNIMN